MATSGRVPRDASRGARSRRLSLACVQSSSRSLTTAGAVRACGARRSLAAVSLVAGVAWGLLPLREAPSDARIARFIEERKTELDERLVSAVGVASGNRQTPPALAASMVGDAARAASTVDPAEIVASEVVAARRDSGRCGGPACWPRRRFSSADKARQSYDAVVARAVPGARRSRGHAGRRARSGRARTSPSRRRLVGNQAPVVAQLLRVERRRRQRLARDRDAERMRPAASRWR